MPADRQRADRPVLVVPPSAARVARLARRIWRTNGWATQIAGQVGPSATAQFGAQLIARWTPLDSSAALGVTIARRFVLGSAPPHERDLTLSPYAPPLRQISAARQGAAPWDPGGPSADPTAALLSELAQLNWGQPPE